MINEERLYEELIKAGVNTNIPGGLLSIKEPYPTVIPVYIDFLQNEEFESIRIKEMLVRMLTVKEAKGIANETLISEYHKYPEEGIFKFYRWAIGNAFTVIITNEDEDDVLSIVTNNSNGMSRQMFVYALKKIKTEKVENAFISLLDDDDVSGRAINALGILKSKKAKEKITPFLLSSNAWRRKEAQKALKRIG